MWSVVITMTLQVFVIIVWIDRLPCVPQELGSDFRRSRAASFGGPGACFLFINELEKRQRLHSEPVREPRQSISLLQSTSGAAFPLRNGKAVLSGRATEARTPETA